jgi:CBS domain-containing protein
MHDIAEFLGRHDPFSGLDEAELERLAARTEVEFHAAGATIVPQGEQPEGRIRVVRRGSVELLDEGRPVDLLGEGEMFGHPSALSGLPTILESRAREDTLTYALPAEEVIPLLGSPTSLRFLARSLLARGRRGDRTGIESPSAEVARQSAADLVGRPPVTCEPSLTVRDAARLMDSEEVSSVLVELGDGEFGIVTDRDLRSQVVVGGRSPDEPVSAVMSSPAIGVAGDQTGADVMLTMLDHDIRHVPVFSPRSEAIGVIVGIDLVAAQARAPFVLRRAIAAAETRDELRDAAGRLPSTVVALQHAGMPPARVSEVISVVADALVRRIIELAIESEGPPPAEFAWMALGSHGRREPVPSSDVDSGMAWSGGDDAAAYMQDLAEKVADAVQVVGWRLDPHGVTASGAFSASSIEDWRRAIRTWLARPSDNRVLIATSILVDGRVIYGPERDLDVKPLLFEVGDRDTLLHWMLRLALAAKPPTGFLRDIVVESSGEHRGTLDIKHGGLLPIVDLARYAALHAEIKITPTVERLRATSGEGVLDATQARVLEEAYDLFSALRLEHQVEQLEAGDKPDDHLDPKRLNPLARRYLRDAFREVASVQHSLAPELRQLRWVE